LFITLINALASMIFSHEKRKETCQMKKGEGVYNVVVIGAGTAGLVTAAGTAGLGGRVALIERNLMGGDCLNFGCVPSKALISSARLIQQIRESEKWGLDRQQPQFAFAKIFERMRARRAKIAPNDSQERFESLGVDVYRGEARFVSPHEIEVTTSPSPQSSPSGRGGREAPGEGRRLRAKILWSPLVAARRFRKSKASTRFPILLMKRFSMS
jgi:hypothetical protein